VFKGDTSLSKAHRLIRRFSEDVDLVVVTPGESKGAVDRCLKGIAAAVGDAIGVVGSVDAGSATKGRKRNVTYEYPGRHHRSGLRQGVLFEEAETFDLRVLEPVRTLVEKLMILHHGAVTGSEIEQIRHARHYYDVWCLLNNEATVNAFAKWPCDALAREVETFTAAAGLPTSPRPPGGFAESPAFVAPSDQTRAAFAEQVVGELIWGDVDAPAFDECCAVVVERAATL